MDILLVVNEGGDEGDTLPLPTMNFDPDQPRDEDGKWSDSGGGGGADVAKAGKSGGGGDEEDQAATGKGKVYKVSGEELKKLEPHIRAAVTAEKIGIRGYSTAEKADQASRDVADRVNSMMGEKTEGTVFGSRVLAYKRIGQDTVRAVYLPGISGGEEDLKIVSRYVKKRGGHTLRGPEGSLIVSVPEE